MNVHEAALYKLKMQRIATLQSEIAILQAERDAYRKDKDRLDWLEKHCDSADNIGYGSEHWWHLVHNDGNRVERSSLRSAIDEARNS